jgi:hypothetical protein
MMNSVRSKGPPGVPQSSPVHPSEHTHLMSSEQLPFLQEGLQTVYREVCTYTYIVANIFKGVDGGKCVLQL